MATLKWLTIWALKGAVTAGLWPAGAFGYWCVKGRYKQSEPDTGNDVVQEVACPGCDGDGHGDDHDCDGSGDCDGDCKNKSSQGFWNHGVGWLMKWGFRTVISVGLWPLGAFLVWCFKSTPAEPVGQVDNGVQEVATAVRPADLVRQRPRCLSPANPREDEALKSAGLAYTGVGVPYPRAIAARNALFAAMVPLRDEFELFGTMDELLCYLPDDPHEREVQVDMVIDLLGTHVFMPFEHYDGGLDIAEARRLAEELRTQMIAVQNFGWQAEFQVFPAVALPAGEAGDNIAEFLEMTLLDFTLGQAMDRELTLRFGDSDDDDMPCAVDENGVVLARFELAKKYPDSFNEAVLYQWGYDPDDDGEDEDTEIQSESSEVPDGCPLDGAIYVVDSTPIMYPMQVTRRQVALGRYNLLAADQYFHASGKLAQAANVVREMIPDDGKLDGFDPRKVARQLRPLLGDNREVSERPELDQLCALAQEMLGYMNRLLWERSYESDQPPLRTFVKPASLYVSHEDAADPDKVRWLYARLEAEQDIVFAEEIMGWDVSVAADGTPCAVDEHGNVMHVFHWALEFDGPAWDIWVDAVEDEPEVEEVILAWVAERAELPQEGLDTGYYLSDYDLGDSDAADLVAFLENYYGIDLSGENFNEYTELYEFVTAVEGFDDDWITVEDFLLSLVVELGNAVETDGLIEEWCLRDYGLTDQVPAVVELLELQYGVKRLKGEGINASTPCSAIMTTIAHLLDGDGHDEFDDPDGGTYTGT